MPDSPPRSFLICRLSALGDCIHTLPLASALRERFPAARITWVVEQPAAPLLQGHSAIDRLIVLPRGFLKSRRALLLLRNKLRSLRPDVALDPQSLTKSAAVTWLSGAPRRIGFARPLGRELSPLLNNRLVAAKQSHAVDQYLELLQPLGVPAAEADFGIPDVSAARERIAGFVSRWDAAGRLLVIQPGAGWDSKLWPPERFAEVARRLGEARGITTAVAWAGPTLRQRAEMIVERAAPHALLAPATSLPELAAMLRSARLFLGSDTGPMHLAAAVGTPVVALFGPTRPAHNGPYGAGHVTIQKFYPGGTTRQRRYGPDDAMRAISAEEVYHACVQILDRSGTATCRVA